MNKFAVKRTILAAVILCLASLILVYISGCAVKPGQPPVQAPTSATPPAELDSLQALLQGFVDRGEAPGVSLLLAQHGKVVFQEAYGLANLDTRRPFTADTITWIASTTKPLSATCVMILVDEGKISLDDLIAKYLPAFGELTVKGTGAKAPLPTIRQLLSHTSGMAGLMDIAPGVTEAIRDFKLTMAESVDLLGQEQLVAAPGSRFSYGGASFQVAGRIVELVSGQPFDVFMQERLLKPLAMVDTTFKPQAVQFPRIANIYQPGSDGFSISPASYLHRLDINLILAGGGLYSTLGDLAVFLQMHLNGGIYGSTRILSPSAVAEMQKVQTGDAALGYSPSRAGKNYGLGWICDRISPDGKTLSVSHGGMFGSVAWIDLDRNLVGIFFTNVPYLEATDMHWAVRIKVLELFPTTAQ